MVWNATSGRYAVATKGRGDWIALVEYDMADFGYETYLEVREPIKGLKAAFEGGKVDDRQTADEITTS